MSTVTKRYFIAEGARAEGVIAYSNDRLQADQEKRREILAKWGATGTYGYLRHAPYALLFDETHSERKPGFCAPDRQRNDGTVFYIHKPNKASKVGKALAEDLASLKPFDFSEYACQEFGVSHSVIGAHAESRSGCAMYSSAAGFYQKRIVFVIPFGGETGMGRPGDIEIPPDLREIKKSEFFALTEEGQS